MLKAWTNSWPTFMAGWLQQYEIVCPGSAIGMGDSATLKDKAVLEKLKSRWGSDPVHLTPAGFSVLAEALIDNCNIGTEEKKATLAPRRDNTTRRDGLSRSDWTASRWDSGTMNSGQERRADSRGRQADSSGRPGKRYKH